MSVRKKSGDGAPDQAAARLAVSSFPASRRAANPKDPKDSVPCVHREGPALSIPDDARPPSKENSGAVGQVPRTSVRALPEDVQDWFVACDQYLGRFAAAVDRLHFTSDSDGLADLREEFLEIARLLDESETDVFRLNVARRAFRDSCWSYARSARLKGNRVWATALREDDNGHRSYERFKEALAEFAKAVP